MIESEEYLRTLKRGKMPVLSVFSVYKNPIHRLLLSVASFSYVKLKATSQDIAVVQLLLWDVGQDRCHAYSFSSVGLLIVYGYPLRH